MINQFKVGDLIRVVIKDNWTLTAILDNKPAPYLREVPVSSLEIYTHPDVRDKFKNIEGKLLLVVYVSRNKLNQPLGYRVLLEGHEVFCKAIVADKYFKLVENQGDESR